MKHREGNLIDLFKDGDFDVIIHGCNCGHNMGSGIAKTIREEFPSAYDADCTSAKWDLDKMGTFTFAEVPQGFIVNAYTQYHWVGKGVLCDYEAVDKVFSRVKDVFGNQGRRFGVPAIGAGRAGGDWNVIKGIIESHLGDEDVTFVEFTGFDPRGNFRRNMRGN